MRHTPPLTIQSIQQLVDKLPAAALAELFDRIKPDEGSEAAQGGSSPVPEGVMHTWLDEPQSPASAVEAQGGNAADTSISPCTFSSLCVLKSVPITIAAPWLTPPRIVHGANTVEFREIFCIGSLSWDP